MAALLSAMVPVVAATASAAESSARESTTEIVVVDVSALPRDELPPAPAEKDAPAAVTAFVPASLVTVVPVKDAVRSHRLRRMGARTSNASGIIKKVPPAAPRLVEIAPRAPSLDALYPPSREATEQSASKAQQLSCGERGSVLPIRWETFVPGADGPARLYVRDLWFDARSCAVGHGAEKTVSLQAIAWRDGKPWLFATRSASSVTLVMPRATEVSAESMVGAPVAVRSDDFTRVTLPIGRWGSASVLAVLDTLVLERPDARPTDGDSRPIEVGVELVQTMSEETPTLLVRTRPVGAIEAAGSME